MSRSQLKDFSTVAANSQEAFLKQLVCDTRTDYKIITEVEEDRVYIADRENTEKSCKKEKLLSEESELREFRRKSTLATQRLSTSKLDISGKAKDEDSTVRRKVNAPIISRKRKDKDQVDTDQASSKRSHQQSTDFVVVCDIGDDDHSAASACTAAESAPAPSTAVSMLAGYGSDSD